jgi:hypothetical protein
MEDTSFILQMEDILNFFVNRKQPQYLCQWKTAHFKNGRRPQSLGNGRQIKYLCKGKEFMTKVQFVLLHFGDLEY